MLAAAPWVLIALVATLDQGLQEAVVGELRLDPRTPFFRLESALDVGNKGEEHLYVGVEAACGEPAWLFHHAEVSVQRSRFGGVQLIEVPPPGCHDCTPVRLRWYHEPTGHLSFEINVYRRLEVVTCNHEHDT